MISSLLIDTLKSRISIRTCLGSGSLPSSFLLDNCNFWQVIGAQKRFRRTLAIAKTKPKYATISKDKLSIYVFWEADSNDFPLFSKYSLEFLNDSVATTAIQTTQGQMQGIYKASKTVPSLEYTSFTRSSGFGELVSMLYMHGLVLLTNCPTTPGTVGDIARLFGPLSHDLYGSTFDVKVVPNPINVAYSSQALELHQDLVYYESPPGLQFLHVLQFDPTIEGGESTFLDSIFAAEEFSRTNEDDFSILKSFPACFQKVRDSALGKVRLQFHRPHIAVDSTNKPIAVFWAPPFEGKAVFTSPCAYEAYLSAYAKFQEKINSEEFLRYFGFKLRLRKGDLIIFNNRRMLHGRNAFKNQDASKMERHFQGCYVSIDDYLQTMRVLQPHKGLSTPIRQGYLTYYE